jgi:hypothetical protein
MWKLKYVLSNALHMSSHFIIIVFHVARSLVVCEVVCTTLLFLLSLFIWSLCCIYVFDLRLLITPCSSLNFSCYCFNFVCLIWYFFLSVINRQSCIKQDSNTTSLLRTFTCRIVDRWRQNLRIMFSDKWCSSLVAGRSWWHFHYHSYLYNVSKYR